MFCCVTVCDCPGFKGHALKLVLISILCHFNKTIAAAAAVAVVVEVASVSTISYAVLFIFN